MIRKALSLCVVVGGATAFLNLACGSSTASATSLPTDSDASADAGSTHVANGQIGDWITMPSLPVPRANHCSVVANGFLVVIGGNYQPADASDFQNVDEVDVAQINSDGSLGAWKSAGKMPAAVNSCTAVASGNRVIVLDGIYDVPAGATSSPYEGVPQVATIGDDGTLSAFTSAGALPTGVRVLYSSALAQAETIFTMFSRTSDEGDDVSLLSATLSTESKVSAFTEQRWLPGFRGHPQYAFAPPYFYALGGYDATDGGNDVLATGEGTVLAADGTTSKPYPTAALPVPTAFGAAIALDSWVFVAGGKNGVFSGEGSANVFAGQMDATGNIAAWATLAKMPAGRTSLSIAAGGDFIYVTGGGDKAGGLDTVFAVQARFAP